MTFPDNNMDHDEGRTSNIMHPPDMDPLALSL